MAYGGACLLVPWGFDGDSVRWGRRCCWAVWLGGTYICWVLGDLWQCVIGWWFGGCCALPDSMRVGSWGVQTYCWVRGHSREIWAGPCAGISAKGHRLWVSGPSICWSPEAHSPVGRALALAVVLALPSGWALGCPWDMPAWVLRWSAVHRTLVPWVSPWLLPGCGAVWSQPPCYLPGYIQCQTFLPAATCTHKISQVQTDIRIDTQIN